MTDKACERPALDWQTRTVQVPEIQKFSIVELNEQEVMMAVREYVRNRYGLTFGAVEIRTTIPDMEEHLKVEIVQK